MAEEQNKSNIKSEYNIGSKGLNLDNSQNNIEKGHLSYALNAAMENFDANSFQYQNEPGNEPCFDFPEGYKLVGKHFIPEQNRIIFFITNPETGGDEIGYMINNDCIYHTLVNDPCLNFSLDHPILSVVHRIEDDSTELYWPDNNGRRYLDIENIPWIPKESSDKCSIIDSEYLDCGKLLLQPDVNIPIVSLEEIRSAGEITSGTYQFTVQYSDARGNPYTSYYGVTNPIPIADTDLTTVNFDYNVGKSIVLKVDNLNPLGHYKYFNLAVIKTVNKTESYELVGTYTIEDTFKVITYTGQNKTNIRLSSQDIYEKFAFYNNADYVTAVQDILVWKGVKVPARINYQHIANKIKLQWESWRIPATESYADEKNATDLRGYLRDEVYAFEIVFILKNGKETDGFHIPGRVKGEFELSLPRISQDDPDFIGTPDPGETTAPYWRIYNTATVEGTSPQYTPNDDYKGPFQYGEFAYWESTEEYPCDETLWGELAGKKIRHHKFPDVKVSPIIEGSEFESVPTMKMENSAIYPIGVKIDSTNVQDLIERSSLTKEQKEEIVGFKIVRADRSTNKSIVAKGMLRNVGKYEKDERTFLYPNYPYNDISKDPFLTANNNAFDDLCQEYTIEVYNLPKQEKWEADCGDSDLEYYVAIEYNNCIDGKAVTKVFSDPGTYTVCATTKPAFISGGTYNEMIHGGEQGSIPKSTTDAIVYQSDYDLYLVGWNVDRSGRDADIIWNDIVTGDSRYEMNPPGGKFWGALGFLSPVGWIQGIFPGPTLIVRVPPGEIPVCSSDSDCYKQRFLGNTVPKFKFVLLKEVRSTACSEIVPINIEEDAKDFSNRQVFNSPDTAFGQPYLGNILKLESVMFGKGRAHFVPVKDNAEYRLITKEAQRDALKTAESVAAMVTDQFNLEAFFAVYNAELTILRNEITKRNFAHSFNSIASYNYTCDIPNGEGIKQRNLDIKKYIIPEVLSVGEDEDISVNNWNRETSVFLRAKGSIPFPSDSTEFLTKYGVKEKSRFTICGKGNCESPSKEESISVVSYYGSIKNEFVNQYGQIFSYDVVDTGFISLFDDPTQNRKDTIWGGDTFIGKFAYKTKVPFFFDNRVKFPDGSDIFYDEIGNIAHPTFWHSSRSRLEDYHGYKETELRLSNLISYKATNFDCPNFQGPEELEDGDEPNNYPGRTYYDGYYYLFAYGIPSFYCESSYNLDLRTAFNNKDGEFWPHVSTGIPDDWVQETNVPIGMDNTYNYNVTFSKQHRQSVIKHLPADWDPSDEVTDFPFRAVYSDALTDSSMNNWLTYRPASYFDFPQNYGKLTALDGLKNSAILARFENKSLLYNNLITLDTSNKQSIYVGNPRLFDNRPIDYAETDQGHMGSQHKMLLKTPYGAVSVDAKRGNVFLINGPEVLELSKFGSGMNRWFTAHLPFEILKYFPSLNIDNNFNGIGLHGVFDSNYDRAIITKLDYVPLYKEIINEDDKWFIVNNNARKEIYLTDPDYFCNVSWTISYNFNSGSWISFHSYIPNWYVGENNFFYSGLNYCPNDFDALVGVFDNSLTTTTTTTIRIFPTTTTTTTIAPVKPDCDFDVTVEIPDCILEGFGEFVDAEPVAPCQRPEIMRNVALYTGYTLTSPIATVDSTGSKDDACAHLNLLIFLDGDDSNYTPTIFYGEAVSVSVGARIYDKISAPDCQSTVPDGWYFNSSSLNVRQVFEVVDGIITQIESCSDDNITTTTTTTTAIATTTFCYQGMYPENDPLHPLGGIVKYFDANGIIQETSFIWFEDGIVSIEAVSIISAVGVHPVACP